MGKAKGTKSPTLDLSMGGGAAQEEQGTSLGPRGREEGPSSPHLGLEKLMQSWAERNQKRTGSMESYREGVAGRVTCTPGKGRVGGLRLWGIQRMGQPLRRLFFRTCRPARVAISKTSRTPSLVLAEHSR